MGGKKNAEKVRNDASDLLVNCIVGIVIVGIIVILILVFLVYVVHKLQELRNTAIGIINENIAGAENSAVKMNLLNQKHQFVNGQLILNDFFNLDAAGQPIAS